MAFTLLSLCALFGLPGLLLCLAASKRRPTLLELLVLSPALGLLFTPALALALMALGVFDMRRLLALEAVLVLAVGAFVVRRGRQRLDLRALRDEMGARRAEYAALVGLTLAVVAWAGAPSEWVLSESMDAANYVIQAAYQAEHESLFFADAQPDVYAGDFPTAAWRLNSTSGTPRGPGEREFPFPPFFRALLALMLAIGGLPLVLHTPLLLGLLAGLCGFLALASALRTRQAALLATALMMAAPVVVQFLRVTLAELCFLLATMLALALFGLARSSGSRCAAALAGLVLALAPLIRADGLFVWAGGLLALAAGLLSPADDEGGRLGRAFGTTFLWGSLLSWSLAAYASAAYLDGHLRGRLSLVSAALLAAALGFSLASRAGALVVRSSWQAALRFCARALIMGVAAQAALVLLVRPLVALPRALEWLLAALYSRPSPGAPDSFASLGYLTLPTVLLGTAGLVLVALEGQQETLLWGTLFALGAGVFLYAPHHMPGAYWVSRRSLGHLLPLLVLGSACALRRLEPWLTRRGPARAALWLLLLGSLLAHNALINWRSGRHYAGASESLSALAGSFPAADALLIDGRAAGADALQLGLRYLHRREALAPRLDSVSDDELLAFWRKRAAAGRSVQVVSDSADAAPRLLRLFELQSRPLALHYCHWSRRQAQQQCLDYVAYRLVHARPPA